MKSLQKVDAQMVGAICIDSTTFNSVSDVFEMNNMIQDIDKIILGKRVLVGKLIDEPSERISVKFYEIENYLIGIARCCGEKTYQMLQTNDIGTNEFAWCYIDLLADLAKNIRIKSVLSKETKQKRT